MDTSKTVQTVQTSQTEKFKPFVEFYDGPNGKRGVRFNFHKGQIRALQSKKRIVAVLAGAQSGKALDLDTPIPTLRGHVAMRDIIVGDVVFDEHGQQCHVTSVSPIMFGHRCYEVTFDDGSFVVADAEHLWVVQSARQRKNQARRVVDPQRIYSRLPDWSVMTTEELSSSVLETDKRRKTASNWSVDLPGPVQTPSVELPIPPYTLGAWLGDGNSRVGEITCADEGILDRIRADGVSVGVARSVGKSKASIYTLGSVGPKRCEETGQMMPNGSLTSMLRQLCLSRSKHIPSMYLRASISQRFELLQGLMDTDGYASPGGDCEYSSSDYYLACGVLQLIRSLGIKARIKSRIPRCQTGVGRRNWRITFTTDMPVFHLERKACLLPSRVRPDVKRKYIDRIEEVETRPVRCITVSSESRQFLCGDYTPTHNSLTGSPWLLQEIKLRGPGDYLIVTPNYPLLERKALPEFRKLFVKYMALGSFRDNIFYFSPDGSRKVFGKDVDEETRVLFGHAGNSETLEGATVKGAWLDEAGQNQFKVEAWEAIRRRLTVHQGRVLITTTPYNMGWLYQRIFKPWQDAKRNHPYIEVIQYDSLMNPNFSLDEYEQLRLELPAWKFRMFHQGQFERPAGLIYEEFNLDPYVLPQHVMPYFDIPAHWPRWMGLDFGSVNTCAIYAAEEIVPLEGPVRQERQHDRRTGRFFVYREYHHGGRTAKQHVEAMLKGEPLRPTAVGGAGSEQQWRDEFAAAGLAVKRPNVTEIEVGIDRVHALIKANQLIVLDNCTGLLDEIGSYSREVDEQGNTLEGIENQNEYHHCFVAGTMIETARGPVPIEKVRIGDMALTRSGWSPVSALMLTDGRQLRTITLSNGATLTGTPDHPVFVLGRGFVRLDSLRYGDMLIACQKETTICGERKSGPTGCSGFDTLMRSAVLTAGTSRLEASGFTDSSGRFTTEKSPLVFRSITRTGTRRIMTYQTLNCLLQSSTLLRTGLLKDRRRPESRLQEYVTSLLSGIEAQRGEPGTANMPKGLLATVFLSRRNVSSAAANTSSQCQGQRIASAQMLANQQQESSPASMMLNGSAPFATRHSLSISTPRPSAVPIYVLHNCESGTGSVYNLTVEGQHEYFANGVLVSNCDAMRYLATLIKGSRLPAGTWRMQRI